MLWHYVLCALIVLFQIVSQLPSSPLQSNHHPYGLQSILRKKQENKLVGDFMRQSEWVFQRSGVFAFVVAHTSCKGSVGMMVE